MGKKKQRKSWIGVVIAITLFVTILAVFFFRSQSGNTIKKEEVSFQQLLSSECRSKLNPDSPVEVSVSQIPLNIPIDDLVREKATCGAYGSYIFIPLGNGEFAGYEAERFITISDEKSEYCCEAPSDIEPAGRKILTIEGIDIYAHTGHWNEGPNSGYKPIFIRGIRSMELPSKETVRIVLDRIAIPETDKSLQKLEDKYKVLDLNHNSGKYIFSPEIVEDMLADHYFDKLRNNPTVSKVVSELKSITAK